VDRYMNGIKHTIYYEMSTHYFRTLAEAYQVSMKVEEKFDKKNWQKLRGRGPRGIGRTSIANENGKEEESTGSQSSIGNGASRGRGFRRRKGKFVITCYRCGVERHKALECLEK